jgi:pimeloyl-ACP methyl ester carboxylesterase
MEGEEFEEIANASLRANANRAVGVIIRPPRARYALESLTPICYDYPQPPIPLIPLAFKNRSGVNLFGSFYISGAFNNEQVHRCVIYLHGNVGSQQEGRFIVPYLAPRGISVFCFDFSGSGRSGGDFVTLGHSEQFDILDSIDFLNRHFEVTDFILWGRSMGAASALLAAPLHSLIKGIIVDSAYSSLNQLFAALARKTRIPRLLRSLAISWIKKEVQQRAHFDCNKINPARVGRNARVPLLLGHAADDAFIPYAHALKIFAEYGGEDKEMMTLTGGHNGTRDPSWIMKCIRFVLRIFGLNFQYFEVAITTENVEHIASFAELMARAE